MQSNHYDVIIIGAGAAGLMCAGRATQRGRRVAILDHADQAGSKIRIAGGGKCNFTNLDIAPDGYLSANPHFVKSALKRFSQHDFLKMLQRYGISWHERRWGQLFCDISAQQIVDMLLHEAKGADLRLNHAIHGLRKAEHFHVDTSRGEFTAPTLVLATGGKSIPKMGASGLALDVARQFGLAVRETRPALAPLRFSGADAALIAELSGIALDVEICCGKRIFRDALLFTHRGLSGPAALQISSYWSVGQPVRINLLPGQDGAALLQQKRAQRPKAELKNVLADLLPSRLALALAAAYLPNPVMANASKAVLAQAAALLNGWTLHPCGTGGYEIAEVMAGGVDTDGFSSKTFEAKSVPGLYVIGEALDVTGWLGGYNLQWAWSSGWCAGEAV